MYYRLSILKRYLEDLLMLPFILIGRILARVRPLPQSYDIFFFFPFYHIGGAEKVHYQIAQATGNKQCIIFFTRKSQNTLFREAFEKTGCTIRDISRYTDNKFLYVVNIIFRGIISGYINRQQEIPLVFNGQCNFAYKLSRWVKREVAQIELIHSYCSFSFIRVPFLPFYRATVMISKVRIEDHLLQYERWGIPGHYAGRIHYIPNCIPLPAQAPDTAKYHTAKPEVLYVGRATAEKRVHLIAQMAEQAAQQGLPFTFGFLGEVTDAIPAHLRPYCHLYGNQSEAGVISDIYKRAVILALVSDTEGFPMVVMEGMAHGLAMLVTPVGDIPLHVKDGENGFLLEPVNDEAAIVKAGVTHLAAWAAQRDWLQATGLLNRQYALDHFGLAQFDAAYRQLFTQVRADKHGW
ncbi:glycosyltransferase family 4 protein [Chitinophaga defluvii]|uniref:Glycosyltransferase n=1 Tax=Chitinophaga defluvii TaxID=3163343 RepID=A0ABV2T0V5_9BACT